MTMNPEQDNPRCTVCGSDLDANGGAHFHGCGNAGFYADEPPTIDPAKTVEAAGWSVQPIWSATPGVPAFRLFSPSAEWIDDFETGEQARSTMADKIRGWA